MRIITHNRYVYQAYYYSEDYNGIEFLKSPIIQCKEVFEIFWQLNDIQYYYRGTTLPNRNIINK